MKFLLTSIAFTICSLQLQAQVALGQWRDHFPWTDAISVTEGDGVVYCATELGITAYNKSDNSLERLTKANALSDVGISILRYNTNNSTLFVGYSNGNIDLIKGTTTINMADIKRDGLIGDKAIYNVLFQGSLAYIGTGFGIVVVDMDNEEVSSTYILGPNESQLRVNAIAIDVGYIWAATQSSGLYRADINSPNLADYNNWSQVTDVPTLLGPFNQMVSYNNELFINYRSDLWNSDTLYRYDGANWSQFTPALNLQNLSLQVNNNKLVISHWGNVQVYNSSLTEEANIYSTTQNTFQANDAIWSGSTMYIANAKGGLLKTSSPFSGESLAHNGPASQAAFNLQVYEKNVWMAAGGFGVSTWSPNGFTDGFAVFKGGEWLTYNSTNLTQLDSFTDVVYMAVDPSNEEHVFAASWRRGLVEMTNGSVTNVYDPTNSSLQYDPDWLPDLRTGVGGIKFDNDGNLWMTNTGVARPLSVLTSTGSWHSFAFSSSINGKLIRWLEIDQEGYKWFINKENGLIVFNDNATPSDSTDDQYKHLTNAVGNGGLPSNTVNCIVSDIDGEVWVGTNEGLAVFYSPSTIFSGGNFDAQSVLIEQDGNVQILLETEIITCFAIDGANRKWIGTRGGGVFLMSDDGTEQFHAFNSTNSPLISDNIIDIDINHETGEVFIATDLGIIAYQGDATGFRSEYGDVYAYPNPVREDYTGPVAIRGLLQDTDVKITDISGNLVYETTSLGGMATWPGTTFSGERVKTGIYLVFLSDSNGKKTMVTKVLFIN